MRPGGNRTTIIAALIILITISAALVLLVTLATQNSHAYDNTLPMVTIILSMISSAVPALLALLRTEQTKNDVQAVKEKIDPPEWDGSERRTDPTDGAKPA